MVGQAARRHHKQELKSGRSHGGTGTDSSTEDTLPRQVPVTVSGGRGSTCEKPYLTSKASSNTMAATIARYFVNRDVDVSGDHEVHAAGCRRLPGMKHRIYFGTFVPCRAAVQEAKK